MKAPDGTPMANVFLTLMHKLGLDDVEELGRQHGRVRPERPCRRPPLHADKTMPADRQARLTPAPGRRHDFGVLARLRRQPDCGTRPHGRRRRAEQRGGRRRGDAAQRRGGTRAAEGGRRRQRRAGRRHDRAALGRANGDIETGADADCRGRQPAGDDPDQRLHAAVSRQPRGQRGDRRRPARRPAPSAKAVSTTGSTPLMLAAASGNVEAVSAAARRRRRDRRAGRRRAARPR